MQCLTTKAENATATTYLYNGQSICLFDVERANSMKIDWSLIESLKDGLLVNTKYECAVKTALSHTGTSHVFIFMNAYPDFSKLSLDRWHVLDNLDDDQTIHDLFPSDRFPGVANLVDPFDEAFRDNAIGAPRAPSPPRHRRRRLIAAPPAPAGPQLPIMIEDDE